MAVDLYITHYGNARIYDTVAMVMRRGFSWRFFTSYYHDEAGLAARLTRMLPAGLSARLQRFFRRRNHPSLDPQFVESSFPIAAAGMLSAQFGAPQRLLWAVNGMLDRRTARRVLADRPRAVLAPDTCALHTFEAAKGVGTICILDQVIGHLSAASRILRDELERHPEFEGTVELPSEDAIDHCIREALGADHILAPSAYVHDTLIEIGVAEDRIIVLPYGTDTERFRPRKGAESGCFRILFAGNLGARKGVLYLLEAVRAARLANAELVLVGGIEGDGKWLDPFQGLFRHIPHVPHHEIHRLFQSGDIYVYPSLHEGSSVSIYEAMATGLPVVTTANSGSIVRDGIDGFIVPLRDAGAITEKIVELYEDAGLRHSMAQAARKRAEEFTWETYGERLASHLGRILAKKEHG